MRKRRFFQWCEPHTTDYCGTTVYALGANTQGIATLQMLNMIKRFDMEVPASSRRRR